MKKTRDNHYVPQWYQKGFFDENRNMLKYLDMCPETKLLPDGRIKTMKSIFDAPTSRCFYKTDLYSTFFGEVINDEIERRLFGEVDSKGSRAVRAFLGGDAGQWHKHFEDFFEYIDSQKIRTPKGLDWLREHYPSLDQNQLMFEMQGVRNMNCTLWTEGVREIVSAEDSDVKFLVSDHPVTVYNYAIPPANKSCDYPNDPSIALKSSQTLFPLSKDFCLILTNLEYAENPKIGDPCKKRTFAKKFRRSVVRTDAFIRSRKLTRIEVSQINYIMKCRACRFIAAGRQEWLYPERVINSSWASLRNTLLPPRDELWHFGGEMYARFEDGSVYFQDEFGRTEKERQFLKKAVAEQALRPNDLCGCGYGRKYKKCCKGKDVDVRPSWRELSIRERNIILYEAIVDVLGIKEDSSWVDIRRNLDDERIRQIYSIYEGLWPLETDLLDLLPKPDGVARAVYTGMIDPPMVMEFLVGASLYFNETILQSPFLHPGTVKDDFSPVENPGKYRQEFLKSVFTHLTLMPLVHEGTLNLIPDPCYFDVYLRQQMVQLARERAGRVDVNLESDLRTKWAQNDDFRRSMLALSEDTRRSYIRRAMPNIDEVDIENALCYMELAREDDPLAILQEGTFDKGKEGGVIHFMKMAPNFEISMFLARATGSFIITDSQFRWREILQAQFRESGIVVPRLGNLTNYLDRSTHYFVSDITAVEDIRRRERLSRYRTMMQDVYNYVLTLDRRGPREKIEAQLAARFSSIHAASQGEIERAGASALPGRLRCVIPQGGITHRNVSRMLLTAGVDHHLATVPMAFFMDRADSSVYEQTTFS